MSVPPSRLVARHCPGEGARDGPGDVGNRGEYQTPARLIGVVSCRNALVPWVGVSVKVSFPGTSPAGQESEVGVAIEPLTVPSTSPRCGVVMTYVPWKGKRATGSTQPSAWSDPSSCPGANAGVEHLVCEEARRRGVVEGAGPGKRHGDRVISGQGHRAERGRGGDQATTPCHDDRDGNEHPAHDWTPRDCGERLLDRSAYACPTK